MKIKDIYILIGILLILSIYDVQWYYNNTLPPTWDDAVHLKSSLIYYDILIHPNINIVNRMIYADRYYPPFFKFSTAFIYIIFGPSIASALTMNVIYVGVLVLSIYGIGKTLFNAKVGLLGAILVLLYPMIFDTQKWYYLDLCLTSLITLSIYILLLTDKFRNFKYSIYFGIVFGIANLTKWTAVIFIFPLFVYNIYSRFFMESENGWKDGQKHYYVLSLIITGMISSIWYLPNGMNAFSTIESMNDEWAVRSGVDPNVLSLSSISFYPTAITDIVSTFFIIIFLIGLIYIILNIRREKYRIEYMLYLFLWIIVPVLTLTLVANKNDRYILPVVSAIALTSAYWVLNIGNKVKYIIIMGLLIVGIIQIAGMAIQDLPKKEDWKHEVILDEIFKDSIRDNDTHSIIVIIPDHHYINGKTFEYYGRKNNMPFEIMNGAYTDVNYFKNNLLSFDYIIIKSGDLPRSYIDVTQPQYDFFMENIKFFNKTFESKLPDDTSIIVYKRNMMIEDAE